MGDFYVFKKQYFVAKLSLFSLIFIIAIFSDTIANDGNDTILKDTILEYYGLEQKELWEKTYDFRPSEFKKSIPINTYVSMMKEDNKGWHLINFEILSIERTNDKATVKIKFEEECPRNYYSKILKARYMDIEENTKWKKKNGKWFCVDCGTRTHLSLNSNMVMEY